MTRSSRLILLVGFIVAIFCVNTFAGSERLRVPQVVYTEPDNDSVIDITGKPAVTFRWKSQPVPSGGRLGFRFKVFKGFDYELIAKEELGRDVFSVDVPAEKFVDGALYSWEVQQRDSGSMLWSLSTRWSFKVKKK